MSPQATKVFKAQAAAAARAPVDLTPGQRAYQDYFLLRNGVNSQGGALPGWSELSADIRAWWEQAGVQPPGSPPWWKNKVFWLNAIVLGVAAAEEQLGMLKDVLPGSVFVWVAFGLPILNKAIKAWQLYRAVP